MVGSGHFGGVRAVWYDGTLLGIKVLPLEGEHDEERERLRRECAKLAGLSHPNVRQVFGLILSPTGDEGGLLCALHRNSLRDYIEDALSAQWDTAWLGFAVDIATGLAYLHAQTPRVVHGGLRPTNVLISRERVAMISDGGLAGGALHVPEPVHVYMPLEKLQKHDRLGSWPRDATPETDYLGDIRALGCLLAAMASRKDPYGDFTAATKTIKWRAFGLSTGAVHLLAIKIVGGQTHAMECMNEDK